MYSISFYIKELKKCSKNRMISDEEFVRELFNTIVIPADITNKNGEIFDLNKSRVSKLLSCKDDVPGALRNALNRFGIKEKVANSFQDFYDDYLDTCATPGTISKVLSEIEEDKNISDTEKNELRQCASNNPVKFFANSFLLAIKLNNKFPDDKESIIWQNGINSISVLEGDLFSFAFNNRKKQKNIVVIPVNDSFDTHVTTNSELTNIPAVSSTTLHGKWLKRFVQSGNTVEQLKKRILDNLNKQGTVPSKKKIANKESKYSYPVGTIAVIDEKQTIYYLLAVSTFNKNNVAHSTKDEISFAIESLLSFYNQHGQGYPLYLPLIGTGRSRAGLDFQESYDLIITVLQENLDYIQGEITIVIQPSIIHQINTERRI